MAKTYPVIVTHTTPANLTPAERRARCIASLRAQTNLRAETAEYVAERMSHGYGSREYGQALGILAAAHVITRHGQERYRRNMKSHA